MIRFVCCGVLLAAVLVGACATTPAETGGGAATLQPASTVAAEPASGAAVAPSLTVDVNQMAQLPTVTCREILKPGSNVLVTRCMTAAGWKTYERLEAQAAAELVRVMQSGRYR